MFDGNSIEFHSSHHHYHFLLRIYARKTHHLLSVDFSLSHIFRFSFVPSLDFVSHKNEIGKIEWSLNSRWRVERRYKYFCRGGSDSTRNTRGDCAQCQIFLPLFWFTLLSTAAAVAAGFLVLCWHFSLCIVNIGGKSWLRFVKLIIAKCQQKRWIVTCWKFYWKTIELSSMTFLNHKFLVTWKVFDDEKILFQGAKNFISSHTRSEPFFD